MTIDWGLARQVGGLGFGIAFAVLIILAVMIWLTGFILSKIDTEKEQTTNDQKGA